jgi:hypothetical protein
VYGVTVKVFALAAVPAVRPEIVQVSPAVTHLPPPAKATRYEFTPEAPPSVVGAVQANVIVVSVAVTEVTVGAPAADNGVKNWVVAAVDEPKNVFSTTEAE